jgi:zinc/manganese transport system substrate-binding protein
MLRLIATLLLFFAASFPVSAQAQEKIKTVASFSILADFVKNVGGERVVVTSLVGPSADAHVFSPTPQDAQRLAAADLVFINGLGFEGWIERLLKSSATKADVIVATKGIAPLKKAAKDKGHDHDHDGHDHASGDPHAWQSVANAKIYVANIRDALIAKDPAGRAYYEANAGAYLARLAALETEVKEAVASLPPERRRIITSHDAFGYFAAAYGLAFIAPQGVSTETEASARDVARIVAQIRREKIPAVFLENISDPRLLRRISEETGTKIGGALYSDALTDEKGDAPTYIDMVRHNIRTLGAALSS